MIFCNTAKKRGEQYTKRMLPAFVSPECNIMLSNVMEYVEQCPQERINYAKAQLILGAKDRFRQPKKISADFSNRMFHF